MKCRSQTSDELNAVMSPPGAADAQYFGNHRNSTRLAVVSVMIFMVLKIANFRALLSCLNFAKRIAVTESRARIPPMYIMHDWYPSYPKAEEIGEAKAIISARKVALMQNTVTNALEYTFFGSTPSLLAKRKHPVSRPSTRTT